ncbi:cation transporter [Ruminococcus sp.]|uniref:cation transporter n=1 Tax=Ruminococcus sp. TaxID=41978 RepID=UPI003F11FD31
MTKTFQLEDLDCANCAAKMQEAIIKLDGVTDAQVNFLTQKMTITAEDASFDRIMKQVVKACRRIEPDCTILM